MRSRSEELRKRLWTAMDIMKEEKLYMHSKMITVDTPHGTYRFPMVIGLAVLNAIVGNGSMLLYGGYGYGKTMILKYLGRLLTGIPMDDIEASILRSNPQLTEEKIVARLHLGKLISEGDEVVIWRKFVRSFWKIIDEINRLSPGAQDAILSILGEGIAKYFDKVYSVPRYVLYATLNPRDVGTFPLGMPLLDRFGIAVIVEAPSLEDVVEITEIPDEKITKRVVPSILTIDDLVEIWGYVWMTPLSRDARLFISTLVKEITLCDRIHKETGIFLSVGSRICSGCRFESLDTVCKMVFTPLSIRAQKDLVRYSKALAWMLGLKEVPLNVVVTIAPYVLWHRLKFAEKYLEKKYYNKFELAKEIVNTVLRNFLQRLPMLNAFEELKRGNVDPSMLASIRNVAPNDLLIKHEILPRIDELLEEKYVALARRFLRAIKDKDRKEIEQILRNARQGLSDYQFESLYSVYESTLKANGRKYVVPFSIWRKKIDEIVSIANDERIRESLEPPKSIWILHGLDIIEVYTINSAEESPVFLVVYSLWDDLRDRIIECLGRENVTNID